MKTTGYAAPVQTVQTGKTHRLHRFHIATVGAVQTVQTHLGFAPVHRPALCGVSEHG